MIALIAVLAFAVQWGTAPVRGKLQAREQINSGANRIQQYDHFFDLCASVQTAETSLDAQVDALPTSSGENLQRVQQNIVGLKATIANGINQYNEDARKTYTGGQFRASDLPFQLPAPSDVFEKGVQTSCVAS